MTLPAGTILSQRYEIHAFVGSDGTLDVYKGLDLRLGRDVAVTVLELRSIQDPQKLLVFEHEAQARAGFHHPRIMTIHDFGHDASCAFQVAEWLDGESLRKRLASGPLDWPMTSAMGRAVLEGLDGLHQKGFTLNVLDETSVFLERSGGIKLFAYDLKRLEPMDPLAAQAAAREEVQALIRLLCRSLGLRDGAPAGSVRSPELSALARLAKNRDPEPRILRQSLASLLETEPAPLRPRARGRSLAIMALLLSFGAIAYVLANRGGSPVPPPPEPVPPSQEPEISRDADARRLCLYGMQLLENRDPESLGRARTYLQGAITRDPASAAAHSGLADCYNLMGTMGLLPGEEATRLVRASAQKALKIDPGLGEARAALAFLELWNGLDWQEAEKGYRLALERAPGQASIHRGYGVLLACSGRMDESLGHLQKALELQPLSRTGRTTYAILLHWAGRPQDSLDEFAKVLEQDPDRVDTLANYREALEQMGRFEEALHVSDRLAELGALQEREASALRTAFERRGGKGYLGERLKQLEQSQGAGPVRLARVAAQLGDRERALRLLARALREKDPNRLRIPVDPAFSPLRSDPRFVRFLGQMGLPAS